MGLNIFETKTLTYLRVSSGHIYISHRNETLKLKDYNEETDLPFHPFLVPQSTEEYFTRKEFSKTMSPYLLLKNDFGKNAQYEHIEKLRSDRSLMSLSSNEYF